MNKANYIKKTKGEFLDMPKYLKKNVSLFCPCVRACVRPSTKSDTPPNRVKMTKDGDILNIFVHVNGVILPRKTKIAHLRDLILVNTYLIYPTPAHLLGNLVNTCIVYIRQYRIS